jgi:hypothetical protein
MSPSDSNDTTNITLALRTLGSFDFEGMFIKISRTSFILVKSEHFLAR